MSCYTHVLEFLRQVPVIEGNNWLDVIVFQLLNQVLVELNTLFVSWCQSSVGQDSAPWYWKSVVLHLRYKSTQKINKIGFRMRCFKLRKLEKTKWHWHNEFIGELNRSSVSWSEFIGFKDSKGVNMVGFFLPLVV